METKKQKPHLGFTILELLIVVAIMGLLGTVSVSGFRGLKKGMQERGAMQNVDEFIRSAYRRAIIDRVPVSVYFWNETVESEESSTGGDKLVVVGRAVAVRRAGRITAKDGQFLVDEFGDLESDAYRDDDGNEDPSDTSYQQDPGRYLYKLNKLNDATTTFARSIVSSTTVRKNQKDYLVSVTDGSDREMRAYGYYLRDAGGVTWNVGDAYGFEIAELTLPKNFIFGSSYSTSVSTPEQKIQVIAFSAHGTISGDNVTVSGLQLDKSGAVAFQSIGTSEDPSKKR